ncbi:MAG: aldose 1-epimerase family protein [Armatimonadota bacterium]
MAQLYGGSYTQAELTRKVGLVEQVAGVRRLTLAEGSEAGVEAIEFRTGTGLSFMVLPGRGMDISAADFRGASLAWRSTTGDAAASFFEPEGLGWLRTFYGGLVVTCGLTYAGAPGPDGDEELGLHGRVSHIPAKNVSADGMWEGDEYVMCARGKVREASVFGPNILLTRTIAARLGQSRIWIHDVVENQGFASQEHMILYHCNLGFPLMDEGTELLAAAQEVIPRDEVAEAGLDDYATFSAPVADYQEQVFYHDLATDDDGDSLVGVVNRSFRQGHGLGLYVKFPKAELPRFAQWKNPGEGTYVQGLEPANCWVTGRADERARGTLQVLEPGEVREYHLEIGVLATPEEIEDFEKAVKAMD